MDEVTKMCDELMILAFSKILILRKLPNTLNRSFDSNSLRVEGLEEGGGGVQPRPPEKLVDKNAIKPTIGSPCQLGLKAFIPRDFGKNLSFPLH